MAGANEHAILDLGEDDFISTDYKNQTPGSMTQFPDPGTPGINKDTERLVDDDGGSSNLFNSSFWTLAFYQQFFDVDTVTVKNRLLYSMVPVPGKSFLEHHIRPKPDLYGPFWICVTLVFSIAISGNIADFLSTPVSDSGPSSWHYDFHKVSLAATAVFSYAGVVPSLLYSLLWYLGSCPLSFLELLCLYGYSLAIYVPVSVLWLVPSTAWQWLCVLLGAGLSGAVLAIPLWPAVRNPAVKGGALLMVIILGLHLLLACGFMLYFFHVPDTAVTPVPDPSTNNSTEANLQKVDELPKVEEKKVVVDNASVNAKEAAAIKASNLTAGEGSSEEKKEEKRSSSKEIKPSDDVDTVSNGNGTVNEVNPNQVLSEVKNPSNSNSSNLSKIDTESESREKRGVKIKEHNSW